mmetsp:Transcript_47993/g.138206  ORF Transcript_47993/g.138206 Transcript_47993/m.138206 type:complete len:167 (-) Transcript_47993:287-787(-)|eukprot:CAMPEP_0176116076 /NCGR_PEP_ID=MMETSP0120_2-20121206/58295_1 /TAXON_ID=160619 /ORGANISM="Kryptoperidinium foliaceum, Strain CCMP 1326" /LENGTH=166 /DNA_ID=CAMNT_0017450323 /DNA_START=80 /DNA_END=580 /DNA_ORIENTATION=-
MVCWDIEKNGFCPRAPDCKWCKGAPDSEWKPKGKGKGTGKGKSKGFFEGGGGNDDMMSMLMNMVAQMKGGKGKGGKGGKGWSSSGKFQVDESGGVLGEFTGTIRSFNDWKCYGFIDCDDLKAKGYDSVFLHGDMKKGYRQGHTVKFTAFLTAEGKVQAKDLKSGLK